MKDLAPGIARLYASALRSHLDGSGEHPLHQAYELGRHALAEGLGVLDLVFLHHDTLAQLHAERHSWDRPETFSVAAEFLAECLSPFEMTLRGYQDSHARLSEANTELKQANATIAAAHEQLKAEMVERKRAEEALLHAQKLQAVGLLAGGVAHNFNNMLAVVLGNLEMARRRITDETIDRYLLAARLGAERGAAVARQLLTFSRQQVLEPRAVDPAEWLAEFVPLLANTLRGDILVKTDIRGEPSPIEVDPVQLELAILNIGMNARDAMPTGGVLRLIVENRSVDDDRLSLHGDYVMISVSDTGKGVAPDIVPRVFEPFFTTKDSGQGTGLGLSQVHGFVHQSGGAVDIESALGEGTTIYLYLPVATNAVVNLPTSLREPPEERAIGRVLVVEDDIEVADVAAALLQHYGYSVKLVHRAEAALDVVQSGERVDLVFSDVIMPGGMNGVQLAEEVHRHFPRLPILLTTGYSDAIASANENGLAVIIKPYRSEDLRRRIDELLRLSRDAH